ncbi:hypothetical protein [Vreelandella boliviensis]|uniref:Uncharacterized protein n=1 Tax=Vreelandella boliviensis LC1 TaxID=1072583 RepID=A0A265DTP8_9GAMM|nr:hypothetical protein [Halomonas boliviensis]EHJ94859.1 hypothetical protein KUC_1818 [Halomonas boliviensis LC1]OZT72703.1 hypothetical protein CE457_18120 [Halomonas boliviensis LC1]
MTATVPGWLQGVWQRKRIDYADGSSDTASQVFWLQGLSCYGDLRIPATRPCVASLGASHANDLALAHQQGATGHCHCLDRQATWQREWGYQPVVDFPEPGDMELHGHCMIERAPSGAYEEEWQRLTPTDPDIHVWLREDGHARLLVIDTFAMLIERRSVVLPSRPLAELLQESSQDPQILLSCEISYAEHGADNNFLIRHSTLPWREGQPLNLCNRQGEILIPGWQLEEHYPGSSLQQPGTSDPSLGLPPNSGTGFAG